jgi:hypothetical protein
MSPLETGEPHPPYFLWHQSLRDRGKCTLEKASCTLPILLPGSRVDLGAQAWDEARHPMSAEPSASEE